jgi:hypothetical protein
MISEYPNEDSIELLIASNSGVGQDITAVIRYAAGTRTDSRDITDFNRW